jgi:CheY-like chemotaxis protein
MSVLDGLETLRRIRADDRSRTLPTMLLTGEGDVADRVHGLESGADDYLIKPLAIQEAVARVRAQIRGRVAWVHELDRPRERRRRLASLIAELPRDTSLVAMASALVQRLPEILDLDGAAIVAFGDDGAVRAIASSGALQKAFPPGGALVRAVGREVASRAAAGAWLETGSDGQEPGAGSLVPHAPCRPTTQG